MDPSAAERHRRQIDAAFDEAAEADLRTARWRSRNTVVIGGQVAPEPATSITIPGYEQLVRLGAGGQGVVFRAIQSSTGRRVAIKLMREGPFAGVAERARFEREIRILARLRHPSIVTIHHAGVAEGWQFFVMDFIAGPSLDGYLAEQGRTRHEVITLFAHICEAVEQAHVRGMIHRDLKPSNVRVDAGGVPHVLDFGLAKQPDDDATEMTLTGQFVGSLPWASPEQVSDARNVDMRSDVYALGVMLFQAVTGQHPYPLDGGVRSVIDRIVNMPPHRPRSLRPDVGDELETIMLKCLAKEPERRYRSAGDLARDLRSFLAGDAIEAKRDSGWYILRKQLQRHRTSFVVGCGIATLLAVSSVLAWSLYGATLQRERAEQSRLWESFSAQAQFARTSDRPGRRVDGLAAIRAARQLRNSPELRDEAVACLALTDLRPVYTAQVPNAFAFGLRKIDRVACAPEIGAVEVRSVPDGRALGRFPISERLVSARFSADGRYLACRDIEPRRAYLRVWDLTDGSSVLTLDWPVNGAFGNCDFDPEGKWIAVQEERDSIARFELPSGKRRDAIRPPFPVDAIAVDPAGGLMALLRGDQPQVLIWDLGQNEPARAIPFDSSVLSLAWAPHGYGIAVGSEDHNAYLMDWNSAEEPRAISGHRAQVFAVHFDQSGRFLATSGWDAQTRVWDVCRDELIVAPLLGYDVRGFADRLALLRGPTLSIWEVEKVNVVASARLSRDLGSIRWALLGDTGWLLGTSESGLSLVSTRDGGPEIQVTGAVERHAAVSRDGRDIYASGGDALLHWRVDFQDGRPNVSEPECLLRQPTQDVALAASSRFLVACGPNSLHVVSPDGEFEPREIPLDRGVIKPQVRPDGELVFVGNWKGAHGRLVHLKTGQVLRTFAGDHVSGAFSPDGRLLAVSNPDQVELRDADGERVHFTFARDPGAGLASPLAFSPDGRYLAYSSSMYAVELADAHTGARLLRFPNPKLQLIGTLEFSGDGTRLLAGTSAGEAHLWDLPELRRQLRDLKLDWE